MFPDHGIASGLHISICIFIKVNTDVFLRSSMLLPVDTLQGRGMAQKTQPRKIHQIKACGIATNHGLHHTFVFITYSM